MKKGATKKGFFALRNNYLPAIITTALFLFTTIASNAQVYQSDAAYGRQYKRVKADSTLLIPTICGTPVLNSTAVQNAAIAYDSCNAKFYIYDPSTTLWDTIAFGSLDYLTDVYRKSGTDSIFKVRLGQEYFAFIDSTGGGGSGITSLGSGWGLNNVSDSAYEVDSSEVASLTALVDTAAAIRADFPTGGGGTGWSLTGNTTAAYPDTSTFIGTINNRPLYFKTNSTTRAILDTLGSFTVKAPTNTGIDSNYLKLASNPTLSPYIEMFQRGGNVRQIQNNNLGIYFAEGGLPQGTVVYAKGFNGLSNVSYTNFLKTSAGDAGLMVGGASNSYIGIFQNGVAFRGVMGFASGSVDWQFRVNGATNLGSGNQALRIFGATQNVHIGSSTTDLASAILNIESTTKGFLKPRMTTTQRNAISSPANGLSVYDTDTKQSNYYDGVTWKAQVGMTFGTAAPAITPAAVGNFFLDTTNKKLYISTGTASSADWNILN